MNNSPKEILKFVEENDVKFIRLTFCDIFGSLKNIAIMPNELENSLTYGIPLDFSQPRNLCQRLRLFPDISTLSILPWRPKSGRVVRFFCSLKTPDGSNYPDDMRTNLTDYINNLRLHGYSCEISTRCEFYLFELDEKGEPTKIPHDKGGYLDVAPLDKCENVRREICLSLEEMGLNPKSSCHKHGPAQNEIDFRANGPVNASDDMVHYKTVVKSIASQCGLFASFMPYPLKNEHGSALNISLSLKKNGEPLFGNSAALLTHEGKCFISGVLKRIPEITAFLNPTTNSYKRFGVGYAPKYIDVSESDSSSIIRIPPSSSEISPHIDIRSADAACNPYIAFKLILASGIEGIKENDPTMFEMCGKRHDLLPKSLFESVKISKNSSFIHSIIPESVCEKIFNHFDMRLKSYSEYSDTEQFENNVYFPYI